MSIIRNLTAGILAAVIVVIAGSVAGDNRRTAISDRVRIKLPTRILLIVLFIPCIGILRILVGGYLADIDRRRFALANLSRYDNNTAVV